MMGKFLFVARALTIGLVLGALSTILISQPTNVNVGQVIQTGTSVTGSCITGRLFIHRTTGVIYNCPSATHTWTTIGGSTVTGGTCTNQVTTAISTSGVPTCTTLTSAYTTGLATTAGDLSQFASTTSAQLATLISNETGSGLLVFATSPSLTTPSLGVATATSINGNTFTTGTYTLTGVAGKTLTFNKSLTLEGTDSTTLTFPSTSATIARTDAGQTFTGTQAFGALTATSLNGLTLSTTTGTFTLTNGKTFAVTNGLTLSGTDSTTMTFPSTSATIARTDAANVFIGGQTIAALVGPTTITEAVGSSGLTVTGATQTSSFPALNISQIWNASGTTFVADRTNVTNTASAAGSLLKDWQVGGVSVATVTRDGYFRVGIGASSNPAYGLIGVTNVGLYFPSSTVTMVSGGNLSSFNAGSLVLNSGSMLGWVTSTDTTAAKDTALARNAAGIVEVNNGSVCSTVANCRDLKLRHLIGSGTAPTVANTTSNSCGTTAATIAGTDSAGKVTVGATSGTSCTITFGTAYASAPACWGNDETTSMLVKATTTTTTLILAGTAFGAGDVLSYGCTGY